MSLVLVYLLAPCGRHSTWICICLPALGLIVPHNFKRT
ncbi:hypothetical protein PUN28_009338 [Cardiocondyla obscurior]|uniref:Uncharacterized protein n=1 Tax=Cardiocondyla obscurior TaxID=286306 RepID=A0AAW2FT01_9HYME